MRVFMLRAASVFGQRHVGTKFTWMNSTRVDLCRRPFDLDALKNVVHSISSQPGEIAHVQEQLTSS